MKPYITVIVPIYNTQKYLDECLDSIRSQTLENIEIICIDDCSPDDSYLIVEKHIENDSRVSLVRHKKNKGLGGARNTGLLVAKSEFIASVDSDDTIKDNMLETLWNAGNKGSVDIVCCGYDKLDEEGDLLHGCNFEKAELINKENSLDIFNLFNPGFCNKLWRRSLFTDNKIFFPEKRYFEDTSTTPRILTQAKTITLIDESFYNYFQREESITSTFSKKHTDDFFKAYDIVLDFLIKKKLLDRYRASFVDYLESGVRFHSRCILSSNLKKDEIDQYLKNFMLEKELFLENKLSISNSDKEESIAIALSPAQLFGSKLFGVLFGRFISSPHRNKLKYHPEFFFRDSKNKFTRFIGSLLRII